MVSLRTARCLRLCFIVFLSSVLVVESHLNAQSDYAVKMDVIRKSVVFLRVKDRINNQIKEAGTGFLIQVPLRGDKTRAYWLLATARHIVDPVWAGCPTPAPGDAIFAVLNKADYSPDSDLSGTVEAQVSDQSNAQSWRHPADDSVDLAVVLLDGPAFAKLAVENSPIGFNQLPTKEELAKIDTGAPIVSAGLLLGVSGTRRNYPVFKFGNVSSKPDEKVTMRCCPSCDPKSETEWIIAASLVPGNSGSPVVYAPAKSGMLTGQIRPFLIGIQSSSILGDDVAGMAPVSFLISTVQDMNLWDADLSPAVPNIAPSLAPTSVNSGIENKLGPAARPK